MGVAGDPVAAAEQSAKRRQAQAAERRKAPQDVYRDVLLRNAHDYAARLDAIIRNGEDADALRALEALNSRVLGKPKETVQQVEVPAELQAVRDMSREEREELWRSCTRSRRDCPRRDIRVPRVRKGAWLQRLPRSTSCAGWELSHDARMVDPDQAIREPARTRAPGHRPPGYPRDHARASEPTGASPASA